MKAIAGSVEKGAREGQSITIAWGTCGRRSRMTQPRAALHRPEGGLALAAARRGAGKHPNRRLCLLMFNEGAVTSEISRMLRKWWQTSGSVAAEV